jgi:heat shock protein HtpX
MKNRIKTLMLLAALTALFLWAGQALGGQLGLAVAVVLACAMNFGAYWFSDKLVLRMHGAREVGEGEATELRRVVADLALRAGLPMPRLYIIPGEAPNAFATGRSPEKGVVAVTEGLLRLLDRRELRGVIAHELGHIKNRDTLVMTVVGALAGGLGLLADMALFSSLFGGGSDEEGESGGAGGGLLAVLLAPLAALLIQSSISRSREFLADEEGARLSGDPLALASALRKLEAWSREAPVGRATPATAHLFIVNPFAGGGLVRLFSTHPSTGRRVERLEALARQTSSRGPDALSPAHARR